MARPPGARAFGIWFGATVLLAASATAQVDPHRASIYFAEAEEICRRDGGRLWGLSLCGPMVFADARTRTIATSQPPPDAERPKALGFANAPLDWGGERWAAYVWDFVTPLDSRPRAELLLHELFHRVQPKLGLMTPGGRNEHLDTVEGRVWLQLEWRALSQALRSSGDGRIRAIRDALAFRRERHNRFPDAGENERVEEIREGLAQYTGTVLAATSDAGAIASAVEQLEAAEKRETLVQLFAPASGTAYGLLLDASSPGWTRRVEAKSDLAQLLGAALVVQPEPDAAEAAANYGAAALRAAEEKRDAQRQALIRQLRDRFVDGPVLVIPAGGGGAFDSRGATPIPGIGTVYFSDYQIQGPWGTLDATKGVLSRADGTRNVPAPIRIDSAVLTGDGWRVTIAPGWVVRPGPRPGDSQILRADR